MNEAAALWLKELGGGKRYPLPNEVFAVAAKLRALDHTQTGSSHAFGSADEQDTGRYYAGQSRSRRRVTLRLRLAKTIESVQPSAGYSMMP